MLTNLDLVAAAGCAQSVKNVVISIYSCTDVTAAICEAARQLRTVAAEWRDVRSLRIPFTWNMDAVEDERGTADAKWYASKINRAVCALFTIPGVTRLYFSGAIYRAILYGLYGRMIGLYADQLLYVHMEHPVELSQTTALTKIQHFESECYDGPAHHLPRLDPSTLRVLRVRGRSLHHLWDRCDAQNGGARKVAFPELRELGLFYVTENHTSSASAQFQSSNAWRLHFPKLQKLHVGTELEICPVLEHAVLPAQMDSITIEASASVLQKIAEMHPPAVRRLAILVKPGAGARAAGLAAANQILNTGLSEHMELEISDQEICVSLESLTCTSLTRLEMSATVDFETVFGIIEAMPRLLLL
ncbi:hypothetical protein H4R18_004965, partial [Coemansia javaensis]